MKMFHHVAHERVSVSAEALQAAINALHQTGHPDAADALVATVDRTFYVAATVPADEVRLPTEANEAALMVLLGTNWLADNAPHRLKVPGTKKELEQQAKDAARYQWLSRESWLSRQDAPRIVGSDPMLIDQHVDRAIAAQAGTKDGEI